MVRRTSTVHSSSEVDRILKARCHPLRRDTIQYFEQERASQTAIPELVDHIVSGGSDSEHTHIQVSLHHAHLPKLAASEWVTIEPETNQIQYHGNDNAESAFQDVQEIFR